MGYTINLDLPDMDETPVAVEQWYDRSARSWVTYTVNSLGQQVGDATYDGRKADAQATKAQMEANL